MPKSCPVAHLWLLVICNLFFPNWQVTPLMSRPHAVFSIIFFKVLTDRLYSPRLVERKIHCHQKKNGPPHVENYVNNFQISLVKTLSIALYTISSELLHSQWMHFSLKSNLHHSHINIYEYLFVEKKLS